MSPAPVKRESDSPGGVTQGIAGAMRTILVSVLTSAIIGLVTLASWVITLRANVQSLQDALIRERGRVDWLMERQVYYHGPNEKPQ